MKYAFSLWYKPAKGSIEFLEEVKVEAKSERDALDMVAQIATDRTQIEIVRSPVSVSKVKNLL